MRNSAIVVSGEAGILSTIPAILGFHPDNSIVVAALNPVGRRLLFGPVIRVDFPAGEALSSMLEHAAFLAANHTDSVAIVLYHPDAWSVYDEEILPFFAGLSVLTVLRVTDPAPQSLDSRVEAANVLVDRRVLRSRDELVASVAHRPGSCLDTELIAHFADANSRDEYLIAHLVDQGTLAELIAAAQQVPDDDHRAAHLCAALAAVAYHHGDGALAQAACARTLTIDVGNRFARLLIECMSVGMPPHELANGLLGRWQEGQEGGTAATAAGQLRRHFPIQWCAAPTTPRGDVHVQHSPAQHPNEKRAGPNSLPAGHLGRPS